MVPKKIHYCWFGPLDKKKYLGKYVYKWKRVLVGYEIIEWNESNFSIKSAPVFVQEAYALGKYAFVSDYVRLFALYHHGGIYLDTDIEVRKSFDDLLHSNVFLGYEDETYLATCVIGAVEKSKFIKELLDYYEGQVFVNKDGTYNTMTNTKIFTEKLGEKGIACTGKMTNCELEGESIQIYPREFFSPYDYVSGKNFLSEQTYAVHHFEQSWLPHSLVYRRKIKIAVSKIFGERFVGVIKGLMSQK